MNPESWFKLHEIKAISASFIPWSDICSSFIVGGKQNEKSQNFIYEKGKCLCFSHRAPLTFIFHLPFSKSQHNLVTFTCFVFVFIGVYGNIGWMYVKGCSFICAKKMFVLILWKLVCSFLPFHKSKHKSDKHNLPLETLKAI